MPIVTMDKGYPVKHVRKEMLVKREQTTTTILADGTWINKSDLCDNRKEKKKQKDKECK